MMRDIEVRVHKNPEEEIISLCDTDILGKSFQDKEQQLIVYERFYKGEHLAYEEIVCLLKDATNVNIVGTKSVALAVKAGIISQKGIKTIDNVPIAQLYMVE